MNPKMLTKLKNIFAKEIDKDVSDFTRSDFKLFEDWIACGLAAEHISYIKQEIPVQEIRAAERIVKQDAKCRNCDNLVINLVNKKAFGKTTLQLSVYCSYWLHKNNQGHKNALYNVSLDDVACTQFLSHKNVLDHYDIHVDDIDMMQITAEDFITLPLTSFVDKGFNIKKIEGQFYLYRPDVEEENHEELE